MNDIVLAADLKPGDRFKYKDPSHANWLLAIAEEVSDGFVHAISPTLNGSELKSVRFALCGTKTFIRLPKEIEPPQWGSLTFGDLVECKVAGVWKINSVSNWTVDYVELRLLDGCARLRRWRPHWENPTLVRGVTRSTPDLDGISIGDRVLCRFGGGWSPATVTGISSEGSSRDGAWLQEEGWGPGEPERLHVSAGAWSRKILELHDHDGWINPIKGEERAEIEGSDSDEVKELKLKLGHVESRRDMFKALVEDARTDLKIAYTQLKEERKKRETDREKHLDETRRLLSENAKIREDYVSDEKHWARNARKWKEEFERGAKEWADAALEWNAKVESKEAQIADLELEVAKLQSLLEGANRHLEKSAQERVPAGDRKAFFVAKPGDIKVQLYRAETVYLHGSNYSLPLSFEAAVDLIDRLYNVVRGSEADTLGTEPECVREDDDADLNVITLGGNYGIRCIHCKGRVPPGERACSRKGEAGWRHYPRCR